MKTKKWCEDTFLGQILPPKFFGPGVLLIIFGKLLGFGPLFFATKIHDQHLLDARSHGLSLSLSHVENERTRCPWRHNGLMESGYTKVSGIQTMGKHKVFSEERSCQPCGRDGCNGTKVSDCLMTLDIEKIKKDIMGILLEQSN